MFENFVSIDFPTLEGVAALPKRPHGFLYAIFWVSAAGAETPFYVGQTKRLAERMADYCCAEFQASADFRVGKAICYLRDAKKFRIVLKYNASNNPARDEHDLIKKLQLSGVRLLNDFVGYDYRTAEEEDEKRDIFQICELLINSASQ